MPKEELKSPPRRTLTKRLIREALLELLKTKSIQKISVRELCDAAGINRTTFYNHTMMALMRCWPKSKNIFWRSFPSRRLPPEQHST